MAVTDGMTHHHGVVNTSVWYPTSADGNDWLNAAAGPSQLSQQFFHNTFQTRSNWPPPPPPPPPPPYM